MSPVKPRSMRSYFPYYADADAGSDVALDAYKIFANNIGAVSATANKFLMRAPTDILIKAIYVTDDTTLAAHNTNYWTFQIVSYHVGDRSLTTDLLATAVDTKVASGGLTANTPRDLAPDQNLNVAAGDLLEIVITKAASATSLVDLQVQVDYVVSKVGATTTSTTTTTTTTTSTTTSTSTTTTTTTTTTTSTSTTTTTT